MRESERLDKEEYIAALSVFVQEKDMGLVKL